MRKYYEEHRNYSNQYGRDCYDTYTYADRCEDYQAYYNEGCSNQYDTCVNDPYQDSMTYPCCTHTSCNLHEDPCYTGGYYDRHGNYYSCQTCCSGGGACCCQCVEVDPNPRPGIKEFAHVGTSSATLLVGGPVSNIPIDKFFVDKGTDICQVNPVKLKGGHAYLVEWSGGVDPIDNIATATIELILDGTPIEGGANYTDIPAQVDGTVTLSGGAIVVTPKDNICHTLELRLITGQSGAEVSKINMRIIELY